MQGTADSINTKADNIKGGIDTVSSQISALSSASGVVKKVQRGIVQGGTTSNLELNVYLRSNRAYSNAVYVDVTIDAVDVDKTFVDAHGMDDHICIPILINSTTLRVYTDYANSVTTGSVYNTNGFSWQVIEFY